MSVSDLPDPAEDPPGDDLIFDEAFVAAAHYVEASAHERLARVARITAGHEERLPWRVDARPLLPAARPPARRRRRGRHLLVMLAILAVGVVVVLKPGVLPRSTAGDALPPPVGTAPTDVQHGTKRLLPAPTVPATGSSYRFVHPGPDGRPAATWNPCDPIHYVVHQQAALPGGDALLHDALSTVSAATGLQFVSDGDVPEGPSADRPSYQPLVYGNRWAPVLIAWSDPSESPDLAGDTAGFAGAQAYGLPGGERYVSGKVVLDTPDLGRILHGRGGPAEVERVLLHELGHLVGLDHTPDPSQVMFASSAADAPTSFADGDLRGLALLGQGACT